MSQGSGGAAAQARGSSASEVVMTRAFDAPREEVFRAWTEPERLARWFAPKGATTPHCTVDLRPGGKFHFCMRMDGGQEIWAVGIYREIVAPERIVYVDSFADPQGNVVPPAYWGMSDSHPAESLVTVTFEEHDGRTTVTVRHAVDEGVEERGGMEQGWTEMLERLGDALAPEGGAR